jgi:hypothetical protein
VDDDLEPAIKVVAGSHSAAVNFNRAAGDGEAKAGTARCPLSSVGDPCEGLEEGLDVPVGYSHSMIADGHGGFVSLDLQPDLDLGSLGGVANGVADDVVEGATLKA